MRILGGPTVGEDRLRAENERLRAENERLRGLFRGVEACDELLAPIDKQRDAAVRELVRAAGAVMASGKSSLNHPAINYDEWQVDHDDERDLRAAIAALRSAWPGLEESDGK